MGWGGGGGGGWSGSGGGRCDAGRNQMLVSMQLSRGRSWLSNHNERMRSVLAVSLRPGVITVRLDWALSLYLAVSGVTGPHAESLCIALSWHTHRPQDGNSESSASLFLPCTFALPLASRHT